MIDDKSHKFEYQLFTFNYLFNNLLNYDEDIETSYWKKWKFI
jgi:hypothetical protein